MAGNAPQNPRGLDDIFNVGSSQQSAYDDLNLNFNAFAEPAEPNVNSQGGNGLPYAKNNINFDPFGNGFGDSGFVPLKPMNPSQQPSKETSPQQTQHPQPVMIIEPKMFFFLSFAQRKFPSNRQTEIPLRILQILLPV